ncbi:MarR family transcriptional regulator [Devosia sp.]|uniref:MarR family winged helix-turn-helix transcriptional regulator n=1 Tax=Devosia sp. TaxID=1871048 RepID=UPI0032640763
MDAWTKFAESIFRLNGLLMQAGESITAPVGQSSARWQVLGRLYYRAQTVAELARDIGHARQSVQRLADALVKEGLLMASAKPDDRRTFLLEVTPEGLAVLNALYLRQLEWSRRVVSQFSDEQLQAVAATLQGIGDVVQADAARNTDGEPSSPS